MRFQTTVLDTSGSTIVEELEAADVQDLHEWVHGQGRTLVRVKALDAEVTKASHREVVLPPRRLLLLTQALYEALDAGVPLLSTLDAVAAQEADEHVAGLLDDLGQRIEAGQSLSDALAMHPRAFPTVYCALVRAGEQSGNLPQVLLSIAGFLEWRLDIAATVKQAMIYPLIVMTAGYAMVLFMLSFVVPRLGSVLSKIGNELPPASRALIGCSELVQAHIVAIIIASIGAVVAAVFAMRVPRVRDAVSAGMSVMPVVRGVVSALAIAQFCRTFGVLLHAGLMMTQSLELSGASIGSPGFRENIDTVRERILGGKRLTEAIEEVELLPPVALSMVKVGEEAGRLPITFDRLGQLYDREVKAAVKRALGLLEPIVTVVLGIVVGGVAVLVVSTIYSAMKGIGK